jgi:hypothetical protein
MPDVDVASIGWVPMDAVNGTIDGEVPAPNVDERLAVKIAPPSNPEKYTAPSVNIGFLHNSRQRALAEIANAPANRKPLIDITRSYGEVNIYGGANFYEGMIRVSGGTIPEIHNVLVNPATNWAGFDAPRLTFSGEAIQINVSQLSLMSAYHAGGLWIYAYCVAVNPLLDV